MNFSNVKKSFRQHDSPKSEAVFFKLLIFLCGLGHIELSFILNSCVNITYDRIFIVIILPMLNLNYKQLLAISSMGHPRMIIKPFKCIHCLHCSLAHGLFPFVENGAVPKLHGITTETAILFILYSFI